MRVLSVRYTAIEKSYSLADKSVLKAHRFCCLGPGDDVIMPKGRMVYARCKNGKARVLPRYSAGDDLLIGSNRIPLSIKEIETEEELSGYHQLEECHYRGKALHGRHVPLIVRSEDPLLPLVLGYIELSTAFLMNRPRARLLNDVFESRSDSIQWTAWKKDAVRQYTNLIVRIARTVVSPEFRGLGLARILVTHAAAFAREHWHVGRLKPWFLEITADMLRYVPFVESAGMHYIGDTEGNLSRINSDMNYILDNIDRVKKREILKEESAGIVDLQVSYAMKLDRIERKQNFSREQLLQLLVQSPHHLSEENWSLLHRIFRLPKPTFLMGLTGDAEAFVMRRIEELDLPKRYPVVRAPSQLKALSKPIEVRDCTLTLSSPLVRTPATRKVQHAFGVSRDMLTTTLLSRVSFSIRPGDIVLICGPSGAGKTTLLSLLTQRLRDPSVSLDGLAGAIEVPHDVTVSTLSELPNVRPLINALGRVSFEQALFALNVSGLAEAHLYVKRFRELSNGQRYRAMVARLIASDTAVWIADEFCATLDPVTANIVSRNLRRCSKELGATAVLAAASWTEFIHELQPDTIVHLRAPWDYRVFAWREFEEAMERSRAVGGERQ